MKRKNNIFFAIIVLLILLQMPNVKAAVNVTPGGEAAPPGSGCPKCSWTYASDGLGVRLSLYKYDSKNLVFKTSIDLVNQPSAYPSSVNTTKYKYGRYSYTKLGKTIDFAKYTVGAKDINDYGFPTIDKDTNWATNLASEVQAYFGTSEADTIKGIKTMFGITVTAEELSQYYIVAEPTAFIYNKEESFYTYATGYEYMVVLDDIDIDEYTGTYKWNLWESQGRVTFLGYMFNGMYNQTDSSKKYEGFNDGRYDYYNFLAQDSNTSIVKTVSKTLSEKDEIRKNNAYAKSNFPYGVMIFWIGGNSTRIGGCSSVCGTYSGDALLKCAENYCDNAEDVTNSTQKGQCIIDKCGYNYTKLSCGSSTTSNGSDTKCSDETTSSKKTCEIKNETYYSYKVDCTTTSTVTYPSLLPTTIQAGEGFEYRVKLNGDKKCTITFDTALWKFKYASSYTNSERDNYKKAIEEFNKMSLSSYFYDSATGNISININERKNGEINTTTKNLVVEENYEKGDTEVRQSYTSQNVVSYHNNNELKESVKNYTTVSSNSIYYQLPSVCVSAKDHLTVKEGTVCGDDNGPYNMYFTDIYADKTPSNTPNNTLTTVVHNSAGMNVSNSCNYTVTTNNNKLSCYITIAENSVCGKDVLKNDQNITFTLHAVYQDKSKTIRYNLDTAGHKEKNEEFNNNPTYIIAKSSLTSSKNVKVYGTVTDGTNVAQCTKEAIISPQTCSWTKSTNTTTGKITLTLNPVSDSSAKYYTKSSTGENWLPNKSITFDSDIDIIVNGKIVTSTGTYTCEYKSQCEPKRCKSLYLPAQKEEIRDYCIANWRVDDDNYTSYTDCYKSCTNGDSGLTCKEQFACEDIDKIRNYCRTSYDKDGYESEATCVNDCACGDTGLDDYYYRTISLNNPFPQRTANANWLGFEKYITDDNDDLTSSTSDTPEYEIVLDGKKIDTIKADTKRYNSITGNDAYGDYVWEDDKPLVGQPYKSKFIHSDDTTEGGFKSYFTYIEGIKTS